MSGKASTNRAHRPLVLLGPTASGKSALALEIAERIEGVELLSVDSMQVYRGMDIGTATPTAAEQSRVRHHLIDLVEPDEEFTVRAFQRIARATLDDLAARRAVPLLVGGTGLYVRAIVDDLEIPGRFPAVAAELDAETDTTALHERLAQLDPVAAARMEPTNRRRILRALEVTIGSGRRFSEHGPGLESYPPTRFVQVALRWDRETLDARIEARYRSQLALGFVDEVKALLETSPGRTAVQALGYKELAAHVRGEQTLDAALEEAISRTRRFARRQERWFRRDPRIHWVDAPTQADDIIHLWDEESAKPVG